MQAGTGGEKCQACDRGGSEGGVRAAMLFGLETAALKKREEELEMLSDEDKTRGADHVRRFGDEVREEKDAEVGGSRGPKRA